MKKTIFLLLLFIALCALSLTAGAVMLAVPDGVTQIESEAFANIGPIDAAFLPESVTSIADDAFSGPNTLIYGIPGTEAEAFAGRTGRMFISAAVTDLVYTGPAWTAPDAPVTLSAACTSVFWPVQYRFSVMKDGKIYFAGELESAASAAIVLSESGLYDLCIEAKNPYSGASATFSGALTVAEHVKFSDEIIVGTGRTLTPLDTSETREVTLTSANERVFTSQGSSITGVSAGSAYVTARAVQPEGIVTTTRLVTVYTAVDNVSFAGSPSELFEGEEGQMRFSVSPANAERPEIEWISSDPEIAAVSETGRVCALKQGDVRIIARCDGLEFSHPLRVALPVSQITAQLKEGAVLYTDGSAPISVTYFPPNADHLKCVYTSMNASVAKVNADGIVTGVSTGTAEILCVAADGKGAYASFTVNVVQGVSRISLSTNKTHVYPGDTMLLEAITYPENALGTTLCWSSSNDEIAEIDQNGFVTAHAPGIVSLTAKAENDVRASLTLRVLSFDTPTSFILSQSTLYLNIGESFQLSHISYPSGSVDTGQWYATNAKIASVSENGLVKGVSSGTAYVTIYSLVDSTVSATCKVVVLNPTRTLVMPYRKTAISGISSNLDRIASVKASAFLELEALYQKGYISASVMNSRKNVISNAFSMYSFPWMTLTTQSYWNSANSENGVKDFQPGIVYYGLPYISGTYYAQRLYNVTKALKENRYYPSADGAYYLLNRDNLYNGKYCGNDCSAMLAISFFGFPNGIGEWKTNKFYSDSKFKTLSGFDKLYPGDIFVRDYRHVAMFLYYANEEKTQAVIIEQGGIEPGINTVSTSIYEISYYSKNSYIPRRLASW